MSESNLLFQYSNWDLGCGVHLACFSTLKHSNVQRPPEPEMDSGDVALDSLVDTGESV